MTSEFDDDALTLDRQICFPLYAASNLLTRLYRPVLAKLGLTYPQYLVMLVLWEISPHSVGEIGGKLHLDSGTLTPLLKRLELSGFVQRSRDPADERRVLVHLTQAGRSLKIAARAVPTTLSHELNMAENDIETLRDAVKNMVRVLLKHPDIESASK